MGGLKSSVSNWAGMLSKRCGQQFVAEAVTGVTKVVGR